MVLEVDLSGQQTKDKSEIQQKPPTAQKTGFFKRVRNRFRVWKANFVKMPFGHKFAIFLLITGIIGLGAVAFIYGFVLVTAPEHPKLDTSYTLLDTQSTRTQVFLSELPSPPKVKDQESPLNGILFTKDEFEELNQKKPMLAMIENSVDARPQAGLGDADIVYETLAESGITRFMAVFWSKDAPKIGPIRSIRTYFLDWSSEYKDPPIANIGQAGYDPGEAVVVPEADARAYIIKYNIKSFGWYGRNVFWRDHDKYNSGVAWEHVAYTETQTLWDDAKTLGWVGPADIDALKFKKDAQKEQRGLSQEIEIQFLNLGSEQYKVKWIFDKDSNTYKRYMAGNPHNDENTNKQIDAKNVIIQHCAYKATGDKNGRIVLTTIGEGNAEIYVDGKEFKGTWKKDSRTGRTHFYNQDGSEVELNRGRIWIDVVPVSGNTELSKITVK